jgi:hypothetical protein
MQWRAIGNAGESYPNWVRDLRGKSGAYAIRVRHLIFKTTTVVYVGESHTGNLYKTLTRHFARWNRGKKWWVGAYRPQQSDPGHTYDRGDCEVMVFVGTKAEAVAKQAKWIAELKPRDNLVDGNGQELEEAPF